jgi:hypothetical protein
MNQEQNRPNGGEQELRKLENQWQDALMRRDAVMLDRLMDGNSHYAIAVDLRKESESLKRRRTTIRLDRSPDESGCFASSLVRRRLGEVAPPGQLLTLCVSLLLPNERN